MPQIRATPQHGLHTEWVPPFPELLGLEFHRYGPVEIPTYILFSVERKCEFPQVKLRVLIFTKILDPTRSSRVSASMRL